MKPESLTLTVTPLVPPQHGLRLIGELDMATVTQLKAALDTVSDNGPVTVDLAGLTFIDSTGLHAFMEFARSQNGNGPRDPCESVSNRKAGSGDSGSGRSPWS